VDHLDGRGQETGTYDIAVDTVQARAHARCGGAAG
jgi:hypothetical protein